MTIFSFNSEKEVSFQHLQNTITISRYNNDIALLYFGKPVKKGNHTTTEKWNKNYKVYHDGVFQKNVMDVYPMVWFAKYDLYYSPSGTEQATLVLSLNGCKQIEILSKIVKNK